MYSKLTSLLLVVFVLISGAAAGAAQAATQVATPAAGQANGPVTIRGHIADPSGALIPGSVVTVNNLKGQPVATATADGSGNYEIRNIAPGSYRVVATFDGFAPFISQTLVVTAGQIKRIDIAMAIQTEQQNVVVTDESPSVSTEADNNGNSLVIKGKDLDALSDDPDELSNELSALAGPSAGPNGGQIYIDGFTGGQLPPKSSIREIRVNQNPYSAEYDKLGFGRIEILTKPGTDKLHGQFMIQGNDDVFNTGNPFTTNIPPYYSYQYNGTLNGSLNKHTSFFIAAEHRSINIDSVYDTATIGCGTSTCLGINTDGTLTAFASSGAIANPRSRTNVSPRIDLQIGQKNTLTARYQYFHDAETGVLGNGQLPTLANGTTTNDNSIQISDTQIITDRIVNETRFQYDRNISVTTPVSTLTTLASQTGFSSGGSSEQTIHDHSDRWEFQNLTTMSLGRHAVKFGTRLRDSRDANFANSGYNGTFSFANANDYNTALTTPAEAAPTQLTYTSTASSPSALANVFDAAAFIQDDFKYSPRLTLSAGLRWESQNHVSDHSDWAPRFSMAWAVDGGKGKQAKTVLRAGYGIFYDRLPISNFLTINRSGVQEQFTIQNPTAACFEANYIHFTDQAACGTGTLTKQNSYQVAPSYHSPYTQQFGASVERQLSKAQTLTLTYLHSTGVHQLVTINANAPSTPYATNPNYDAEAGNRYQYFSEGMFTQNQLIVNTNARFSPNFSIFGFYTLSFANTDGSGGSIASNSYDLHKDYGRAGFVSRNSLFLVGNYNGPWGIRFNPFMVAQAGKPFNITTGSDLNGDSFLNDRPTLANSTDCTADSTVFKQTEYGCLDTSGSTADGQTLIENNRGRGPAAVAVNLRISRSFGIGPKLAKADPNANQVGGPPGGGPPGGGGGRGGGPGGGGPGGGFGPGGFGGGGGGRGGPGGMFGATGTGRKYNLNFSVQALNLFNNINYGPPSGTAVAPGKITEGETDNFGRSNSLQPGIFSQGAAARRIFVQAVFSF